MRTLFTNERPFQTETERFVQIFLMLGDKRIQTFKRNTHANIHPWDFFRKGLFTANSDRL